MLPSKRPRRAPILFSKQSHEIYGHDVVKEDIEPHVGMVIHKKFPIGEDEKCFHGTIVEGPTKVVKEKSTRGTQEVFTWKVHYEEDSDEEDLEREEILEWLPSNSKSESPTNKKKKCIGEREMMRQEDEMIKSECIGRKFDTYEAAKNALMYFPGINEKEITLALDTMQATANTNSKGKTSNTPFTFGLQRAMKIIQRNREGPDLDDIDAKEDLVGNECMAETGKGRNLFRPCIGMRVRKLFNGVSYYGNVTRDAELVQIPPEEPGEKARNVRMWEVTYDDGEKDDMAWDELFRCRANRPVRTNPVRGRQLNFLELFSGCGVVSQEFADRRWVVRSVDTDPNSNATDIMSVVDIHVEEKEDNKAATTSSFRELGFVPDAIWASPPCFTYSNMAGGKHRNAEEEKYEKTADAMEHNHYFVKMAKIMQAAKDKNPHLIVVIENPVGQMSKMPLMEELVRSFGLYKIQVHYCALGRDDKKPTHLWTNDFGLAAVLGDFTCERKCPYYNAQTHPLSSRGRNQTRLNYAAIPQALAEEVAEYISSKFYMDRIRYTKAPKVLDDEDDNN